jgi:hypothetical protein
MAFDNGANIYLPPSPVVPMFLFISNITVALPAVITVTGQVPANVYIPGQLIYLSVPSDYGMYQANALTVEIIAVTTAQFTVALDSTQFDAFSAPPSGYMYPRPATLSPAGSRNIYNFTTLPFHSIGNFGN